MHLRRIEEREIGELVRAILGRVGASSYEIGRLVISDERLIHHLFKFIRLVFHRDNRGHDRSEDRGDRHHRGRCFVFVLVFDFIGHVNVEDRGSDLF